MNLFVGIGKIIDVRQNGRTLRFCLDVSGRKACHVPCVLFEPSERLKNFIEQMQAEEQPVWLQGRLSSYELETKERSLLRIEVITRPNGIKAL